MQLSLWHASKEHIEAYLGADSQVYASLADVVLAVDGIELPAHSQVLASHSRVLCTLFAEFSGEGDVRVDAMLAGYSVEQVKAQLRYLYDRGTLPATGQTTLTKYNICSVKDALLLARLADLLDMPAWHQACDRYLALTCADEKVQHISEKAADPDTGPMRWIQLAERMHLNRFLAQCERSIVRSFTAHFVHTQFAERVSKASLL